MKASWNGRHATETEYSEHHEWPLRRLATRRLNPEPRRFSLSADSP